MKFRLEGIKRWIMFGRAYQLLLFLLLITFASAQHSGSSSSKKHLLQWALTPTEKINRKHPNYTFLKTAEGKYVKDINDKYFLVRKISTKGFVFTYFKSLYPYNDWADSSKEDMKLAVSKDGKIWTDLGVVYNPTWNLRDPSIIEVNNEYFVAYTRNAWATGQIFSIIKSDNLLNWVEVADIDMSSIGGTYLWAPEWFYDNGKYYIIFNSNGGGTTLKCYITEATDHTFTSFKEPKQIIVMGRNNINDCDLIKVNGIYYLWYKNFASTPLPGWNAELAFNDSLTGYFTTILSGDFAGWGLGQDGFNVHYIDGKYRLYFDFVGSDGEVDNPNDFSYAESNNIDSGWGEFIRFNIPANHGTVLKTSNRLIR